MTSKRCRTAGDYPDIDTDDGSGSVSTGTCASPLPGTQSTAFAEACWYEHYFTIFWSYVCECDTPEHLKEYLIITALFSHPFWFAGAWLGTASDCIERHFFGVGNLLPADWQFRALECTSAALIDFTRFLSHIISDVWWPMLRQLWSCLSVITQLCQDTYLKHAHAATSFCTGCGAAEMARAVLQRDVNESHQLNFTMSIPTVAAWDSGTYLLFTSAVNESIR